jgi:hypothetical protein
MLTRPITIPEAVAAMLATLLASLICVAYLWARFAAISPFALLGFAVAAGAVIALKLLRGAASDRTATLASASIATLVIGWLWWLGRPELLPPGSGPDLAHHLTLVDFLERNWRLPDATLVPVMNEMAHYTPGVHLLAVLSGAWTGSDGLHAIYPVIVLTVALKCVFVFLIALRTYTIDTARAPVAASAVLLSLTPQAYAIGSFVADSFFAQAAAEVFAVAMWWAVVVWDATPSRLPAVLFGVAGIGAFLTWPIWIGAPSVTLVAVALTHGDIAFRRRVSDLAVAIAPVLAIAVVHSAGRSGWLAMAGTTGAVLRPSVATFGWVFLALTFAGVILACFDRRARPTLLLVLSIAAQAAALYTVARSRGASTPYMAFKMFYLLIYPLAVLGVLTIAKVWQWSVDRRRFSPLAREAVAWSLLLVAVYGAWKPAFRATRPVPVVSTDLYNAGRWARGHLEAACTDYLVANGDTAYWLHLAVLGNPRSSARTADPNTFVPARAVLRWLEPGGLPYAIVHLPTLPRELLHDINVIEEFGTAAVARRLGPSVCPDAERLAARDATSLLHFVDRHVVVLE